MLPDSHASVPWYRQFWPWVLIMLPMSVVVASMITLYLAIENPFSVVVDDYYKRGLAINQDLAREHRAQEQGIELDMQLAAHSAQLHVHYVSTKGEIPKQLKVQFIHPTLKQRDQTVLMVRTGDRDYSGKIGELVGKQWDLVVEPDDGQWRISTRVSTPWTGALRVTSQ
jgi:hypothetical protein